MKAYYDIEQDTEQWHQIRYGKISGTVAKGLFVDSDTLLTDLISCRLEPFKLEPEGYVSADMLRGNELEPFGRMELSRKIKIPLVQCGWLENKDLPILGISPDSISECETIACELKCPGRSAHMATILSNEIPATYIHQCLHYFTVNPKLKQLYFGSFRPECKIRLFYKILRPDSIINLGTIKTPKYGVISALVRQARGEAERIDIQINEALTRILKGE